MVEDKKWDCFTDEDWSRFAKKWLSGIREPGSTEDIGDAVVLMNFSATAEQQWQFILAALTHAQSDEELLHIAAGPIEHLVGWHGEQFIARIEAEVENNPQLARAMTGVLKYKMSDEIWRRVRILQSVIDNPLRAVNDNE